MVKQLTNVTQRQDDIEYNTKNRILLSLFQAGESAVIITQGLGQNRKVKLHQGLESHTQNSWITSSSLSFSAEVAELQSVSSLS